jgi:hypothetical protein
MARVAYPNLTLVTMPAARDLVAAMFVQRNLDHVNCRRSNRLTPEFALVLARVSICKALWRKQIRWDYEVAVGQPGPGRTLEEEAADIWSNLEEVRVEWPASFAQAFHWTLGQTQPDSTVIVTGIRLAHEDLTAAIPEPVPSLALPMPSTQPAELAKPEQLPLPPKRLNLDLRKANPQREGEKPRDYASRIHGLMQKAYKDGRMTKPWALGTVRRDLNRP